jgi:hypothetical protein
MRNPVFSAATCACGKQGYVSRAAARQNAARLHRGSRMRTYKCDRSDLWHLTSWDAATIEDWRDRRP